ncbi:MAG: major capsid protein [Planctomycetota bacterium JB042]
MAPTIPELTWQSLTATVNEIKSPNQFLRRLLFGQTVNLETETIEVGILTGDREMAPFVKKNGQAIMVEGLGEKFHAIEAPNIRIKRPFTPSSAFFTRRPGTSVFPTGQEQSSAIQQHIARDMARMSDLATNAEEWLVAQAITGTVSYEVDEEEAYTITFPKPSGNTVILTKFWDQSAPEIEQDFMTAKKIISEEVGLSPTDCVMSETAATEFLQASEVRSLLDNRNVAAGAISFNEQFRDDGAIFLGFFGGLRCWMYPRTVTMSDGSTAKMIRDKYVEFLTASPAADNVIYYGAIPDWEAFESGLLATSRFAKSWVEKDPSVRVALLHTRPLPVPRRPGSMVSMKVISG